MKDRLDIVGFVFEPRDAWIGLYWKEFTNTYVRRGTKFYVCLLPFIPFVFVVYRECKRLDTRGSTRKGNERVIGLH